VHLIRYSMQFASWKERKNIVSTLRSQIEPLTPTLLQRS
jgi:hypothetical protein